MQSVCLVNQLWDEHTGEVAVPQDKQTGARVIEAYLFDAHRYQTILQLKGASSPVEIER